MTGVVAIAEQARRVEATLAAHPGVRDVAVVVSARGPAPGLLGYVVTGAADPPTVDDLRDQLRAGGVGAMPVELVRLPALPRTTGGALRAALLPPPWQRNGAARPAEKPAVDVVESQVAAVWADALGEPIGARRDFFDGGGNSFRAARAIATVRATLGVEVPLRAIYEHPTVVEFAAEVRAARRVGLLRLQDGSRPPLILVPDIRGGVDYARRALRHLPVDVPVYGLTWAGADVAVPAAVASFEAAVRTVAPAGPYRICGYGPAGVLAVELARSLGATADPVPVAVVETGEPPPEVATVVAREAVDGFAAAARRGLYREVAPEALLTCLGAPDPVRILHALVPPESRPPLPTFAALGLDAQVEAVAPAVADGAARLREVLRVTRALLAALAEHEPRPYPGRVTPLPHAGLGPVLADWLQQTEGKASQ